MLKAGQLPAPVIQPLRYDVTGTRIKVDTDTYIQIKSDAPGVKLYFTTDGTKPDPFQAGRTGKASTHKYIGPFRLQLGNRVLKAIAVSRDRLRESPISTRYIDVLQCVNHNHRHSNSDRDGFERSSSSELSDADNNAPNEFMRVRSKLLPKSSQHSRRSISNDLVELQGSIDGPINPVNYSGTQINVWGLPAPQLANFFNQPPRAPLTHAGPYTESMIKNLNTPRAIVQKPPEEFGNLPENLKKFFKQIKKLYERDSDFQGHLDYLIENGQLKSASVTEDWDSFDIHINCPKFLVDQPPPPPPPLSKPKPIVNTQTKPIQRPASPKIDIVTPPKPANPPPIIKKPEPVKPVQPPPPPAKLEPDEPKFYVEENIQQGTIIDAPGFNAENDAEALRKSMKGLGTNEDVIVNIAGNRSLAQRLKLKETYKAMFGRDLIEDFKGDTSGNFQRLLVALFTPAVEYDVMEFRKALKGIGTDDSVLIELLTSRSNKRLRECAQLYQELYKKKMDDDIMGDTSGHYRKLLASLLSFDRNESSQVDMRLVQQDVDEIQKAGIKKLGTDESKFIAVFGTRSFAHLRQFFSEYQTASKKTIEESIKSEFSGNLCKTFLALISNIRNRPGYFASEIKKAIKGLGTDEHTLNRIVVSRSEIDTKQIKEEYQKLYGKSMQEEVRSDTSSYYGKLLAELLKDPKERVFDLSSAPDVPHVIEQVEEPKVEETPTLVDATNFNPQSDAERLRKAMKGLGTDEKTIIEILGQRTNKQRQQIKTSFKSMFGRDLIKDLHSELSGNFRDVVESLMVPSDEYDADCYRKAIAGLGTDESALVELLTTRTSEQTNATKAKYNQLFNRSLEADICGDTSGHFRKVLVSLLTGTRPSGNLVDRTQAQIDAKSLLDAGVNKRGTDESKFISIMCTRSFAQLRAMFDEYEKCSGHKIEDDLSKEFSGDTLKVLKSIVQSIRDKQGFLASILYKAMKGVGTKDSALIRVIISRCEVDMVQIKKKFAELSNKELGSFLKGDTSGDYRKILLLLIGEQSS